MTEQTNEMFQAMFKWYGDPQIYQNGTKGITVKGITMVEIKTTDWLDVQFPMFKYADQELDYPLISLGFGDIIENLEFNETFSWLVIGRYSRLDNHNDSIIEFNIGTGVDWLTIKPRTPIENNSFFKVLLTLKKTKSLMRMIKADGNFSFEVTFNGRMSRTY